MGHFISLIAFSSIWIIGYYIYEFRNYFYSDVYVALLSVSLLPSISRLHFFDQYYDPLKYILFAIGAIPFFKYCLQIKPSGKKITLLMMFPFYALILILLFFRSDSMMVSKIIYSITPVALLGLAFVVKKLGFVNKLVYMTSRIGMIIGKYSYSIYIIHYPILYLTAYTLKSAFLFVILSILLILLSVIAMESFFQPWVKNLFFRTKTK